jgi:hypothetical protein
MVSSATGIWHWDSCGSVVLWHYAVAGATAKQRPCLLAMYVLVTRLIGRVSALCIAKQSGPHVPTVVRVFWPGVESCIHKCCDRGTRRLLNAQPQQYINLVAVTCCFGTGDTRV